ncbi:MAG: hypothetical protein JOZ80_13140 [Acidobacteriaceae bacterium]|nr:hypothetical protein [Acidobacteriaceae bacterium]
MSTLPLADLQLRAVDERKRLQSSVVELRSRIRENMDVRKNAREHVWPASGIVAAVGLLSGYAIAGLFTRF